MRLTSSNRTILKKLDVLGVDHDSSLKEAKERITKENALLREAEGKFSNVKGLHRAHLVCSSLCHQEIKDAKKELEELKAKLHPGFVISFDNIDIFVHRRNMTMESQNLDLHWINHQMVENRVSGSMLSSTSPTKSLQDVCNVTFLPVLEDQQRQRHNYIVLTSRILVEYFDALSALADACIQHIPHKYSQEMTQKTKRVIVLLFSKGHMLDRGGS